MSLRCGTCFLLLAGATMGQTFNNQTLTGKYSFRHLMFTTDTSDNISDIRSFWGSINFNGQGNYTFDGRSAVGTMTPQPGSGSGTYSVGAGGVVTLTNPQNNGLTLNARWSLVSQGASTLGGQQPSETMVIGSSTEAASNVFDLFIAIPAAQGLANSSLKGNYFVTTLAFPSGLGAQAQSAIFGLQANAQGGFGDISISGHGANITAGAPTTQTVSGATYTIQTDGSGSATFPLQGGFTSSTQLLSGNKAIYVSSSGNVILGGSSDGSNQDLFVGFKAGNGLRWSGRFWQGGLRFETAGSAGAYSGSLLSDGAGTVRFTGRLHQLQPSGAVTYDFTGVNTYTLGTDGSGTEGLTRVALGAAGNAFVGAADDAGDPSGYELILGASMPAVSGTGVFLNPQNVVNAASFAPAGNPVSPGEFVALYGTHLANVTQSATPPYPPSVAGVSVLVNGVQAPLSFVSPGQINALVPYATVGPTATFVVNNNNASSNSVEVPVAATAPGVFSLDSTGVGRGAILHANFSLVNLASPAKRGETVLIFLTGLGAVDPPVPDGTAGAANPLSKAVATVNALIDGLPATVRYAGLAPLFPGLYQLNIVVPSDLSVTATGPFPLAVQTTDSFHDQVDLIVSP
jgi:uncharacterized protein (TIGR03437 family)